MEGRIKKTLYITMISLLLGLFCFNSHNFAAENPNVRELENDMLDITDFEQSKNSIYKTEEVKKIRETTETVDTPVLQGGISELKAIVGKSQIFKFDEPIKRISITDDALIDIKFLSPKELLVNGKKAGETTVIIWGEEGEPVFFNLFVEQNNITFMRELKKLTPNENFKAEFINYGESKSIKLTGTISSTILKEKINDLAEAYSVKIIDLTETLTPQIMLEVRIVESSKSKNKNRGVGFAQGMFDYLSMGEKANGGTQAVLTVLEQTYDSPWYRDVAWTELSNGNGGIVSTDNLKGVFSGINFNSDGKGILNTWKMYPDKNLAYKIHKAESEGLIKILAEPNMMVANKIKGHFRIGQDVPVPTSDQLGNVSYNSYKQVGITVDVTPTILEDNQRIFLDISTTISELGASLETTATPPINTREGNTQVEVANNETTVISGFKRKSDNKTITKLPFFSNLPYIGKFFDSIVQSQEDTELMIFVTPTIIKPDLAREGL